MNWPWDELERKDREKRAQKSKRRRDSESEEEWERAPIQKRRVRRVARPVMLWDSLWEGGRVSLG